MGTIDRDGENLRYILACSPDTEDGSGSTVLIVGPDLSWDETDRLFNSIDVEII